MFQYKNAQLQKVLEITESTSVTVGIVSGVSPSLEDLSGVFLAELHGGRYTKPCVLTTKSMGYLQIFAFAIIQI